MTKTILFLISAVFVILITIIETRQDYWICQFDSIIDTNWKLWGNAVMIGWIIFLSCLIAYIKKSWKVLLWILILFLIWWIFHDCFLGYWLTGDFTYISDYGFDGKMKEIFQHGLLYLIWKVVILIIATGSYFVIK